MENAKVHIYYGDGKGKTTAAMGLALRMLGAGKTVTVCQFLKDGASSEMNALRKFKKDCKLMYYGEALKFIQMMSPSEFKTCKVIENRLFIKACDSDTDLVVFDEVLYLIDYCIFYEQMLLYYLDNRGDTEVVLTGRNPGLKVKKRADYITKMFSEKHPFDNGEPAREGVEF